MRTTHLITILLATLASHLALGVQPPHLRGTQPLETEEDLSAKMVAGIDRLAMQEIEAANKVDAAPLDDPESKQAYRTLLGVIDERLAPVSMSLVASTDSPSAILESPNATVHRVRWPVLEGVEWEGLLVQPTQTPKGRVLLLPDADVTPEQLLGIQPGFSEPIDLTQSGYEVVIPALINRENRLSGHEPVGKATNVTHREWIYRQAFELGRHPLGYEIQAALSAVDWFGTQSPELPIHVAGLGEGGRIALAAAALDERISKTLVSGAFADRSTAWQEPIARTFFNLLHGFDDADIAARIAPRQLIIGHAGAPHFEGAPEAVPGQRAGAAPGELGPIPVGLAQAEADKARVIKPGDWLTLLPSETTLEDTLAHLFEEPISAPPRPQGSPTSSHRTFATARQARLVRALEDFTQKQIVTAERERDRTFWKPLRGLQLTTFDEHMASERERFWNDVLGRLPDPDVPARPRTRLVRETDTVVIYEVVLDVWKDVFAWGWLALPKNLDRSTPTSVVVCQHGLEGLPESCFEADESTKAWRAYKAFALRLAEKGFVTFAPHNPYRGGDAFRVLQRKLNLTGRTLFSPIIGQHQRILEWLKAQSFVDPDRIAFYGLSYGGKSAMRIPAVLTDYCLSICSGDFNEWIRKNVSLDMPMSYVYTGEYEIWEWNLGRTFNYAEMAALIAPRPFMVERGHDDGVGVDEWVNYEFAKVRRLYNKLEIGDRTTIEHFDGPHTIHGVGTFEFLEKHLR